MPKKRASPDVVVPRFGQRLAQLRGARSFAAVVAKIHAASPSLEGFSRGQLHRYEKGERAYPDPVALFYLAQLYKTDLTELLALLARERDESAQAEDSPPPVERQSAERPRARRA